jgi:hypothetical protein
MKTIHKQVQASKPQTTNALSKDINTTLKKEQLRKPGTLIDKMSEICILRYKSAISPYLSKAFSSWNHLQRKIKKNKARTGLYGSNSTSILMCETKKRLTNSIAANDGAKRC